MTRTRVVGAYGDAHGPVVAPTQPHGQTQPRRISICGDDDRCGESAAVLGADPNHSIGAGVDDRLDHVAELIQRRSRCHRMTRQQLVEVGAWADQAVRRKVSKIGPFQLEGTFAAIDSQALVV